MKPIWPILALATGAFGIGVTEFAPMGLLATIATSLKVSIPTAGLLVTGYALGVVAGAPLLTLPTGGMDRKRLLLLLMAIFVAGNAASALSPSYGALMAARVLTSLCHGAFFGVGSIVAGKLMGEGRQAGGVAAVFSGLTIANIGGVPLAAWVGEHIGWRIAFGGVAGLGVVAFLAIAFALPKIPGETSLNLKRELSVVRRPAVLLALATTALSSAAMFTVFTYISPILRKTARASPDAITVALVIYGVGLTVGNWLGGRFADKALHRTLIVVLIALTGLLVLFALTMNSLIPALATVFAWGVATFAKALYEMDAYQHVKDGVAYPSVLLTTGLNDPRVASWEPTKMAARLQAATSSKNPVILRVETDAGHGIGSTLSQRNHETADIIAFLLWRTGDARYRPRDAAI